MRVKESINEIKSSYDEACEQEEAQEALHLWGAVCTVAEAIVSEVKTQDVSPTLDQLYDEIKRRYKQ